MFVQTGGVRKEEAVQDGVSNDHFGASVALDGGTVLAAAVYADVHGQNSGVAYVFEAK